MIPDRVSPRWTTYVKQVGWPGQARSARSGSPGSRVGRAKPVGAGVGAIVGAADGAGVTIGVGAAVGVGVRAAVGAAVGGSVATASVGSGGSVGSSLATATGAREATGS